jgi:putative membrane protein
MDDTRYPRSLYREGTEPDPRFSLANERTFLAWIRTSLALLAGGVALDVLDIPVLAWLRISASILLIAAGIVAPLQAWFGWIRTERAVRLGTPLPAPRFAGPVALVVILAGVLVAVGALLWH